MERRESFKDAKFGVALEKSLTLSDDVNNFLDAPGFLGRDECCPSSRYDLLSSLHSSLSFGESAAPEPSLVASSSKLELRGRRRRTGDSTVASRRTVDVE